MDKSIYRGIGIWLALPMALASAAGGDAAGKQAAGAKAPDTVGAVLNGFRLVRIDDVPELEAKARIFEHVKTGAQLLYLSNSDDNKVFSIAFRTPPTDETGIAHILEHSVLCGSQRFPTKEPFVELLKGSLQTFLNAFTSSDRTVYPVASRNDQDFLNLMNVYLDAVFFPQIHAVPEILMQEGWHYEVDPASGELGYNGVVYNEMKGALSSPERRLGQAIDKSLFPEGTYGRNSGGDPQAIPSLTQQQFTEFHRRYYHPSNAMIYLYGNGDVAAHLALLDREYLSRFDRQAVDAGVVLQKPFDQPRELVADYSVNRGDATEDKTYLSLNYVVGSSPDAELYYGMRILSYILVDSEAAPLRRALVSAGIGKDVESSTELSIHQPYFSLIVKNSNPTMKEQFASVVEKTLGELVERGIDKRLVEAAINREEFSLREMDLLRFPKGLLAHLRSLDSWTYGADPLLYLKFEPVIAQIREAAAHGYFEQFIRQHMLENSYRTLVVLQPKPGQDADDAAKLRASLAKIRQDMSPEDLKRIREGQDRLRARQSAADRPEDLAKIPALTMNDLGRQAEEFPLAEHELGGVKVLSHALPTNGIAYVSLYFDARTVPAEQAPYVALLAQVLGKVDTAKRGYEELSSEIDLQTGGIRCDVTAVSDKSQSTIFHPKFTVVSKAMLPKLSQMLDLVSEMLLTSKFDDKARLKELVQQARIEAEMNILERGHSAAYLRASAGLSPRYRYSDATEGLTYYRFLAELEDHFDERAQELCRRLADTVRLLVNRGGLLVSVTLPEADFRAAGPRLESFLAGLPDAQEEIHDYPFTPSRSAEAVIIPSKVQYVAEAGDYRQAGTDYSGQMRVLEQVVGRTYLWNRVRVMGGAYGADMGVDRFGIFYLWSYRDPNLKETLDTFAGSIDFLDKLELSERELAKAVIATIGNLDSPRTPPQKGSAATLDYIAGITQADRQRERDEVLATTVDGLRSLATTLRTSLAQGRICVFGSDEKIEGDRKLFQDVSPLKK